MIIGFLSLLLEACSKDVNIKLPAFTESYVIDGEIEQGKPAMVFVTNNTPYFGTTDSITMIQSIVVPNAIVTVSDGVNSEVLTKTFLPDYIPPIGYMGTSLLGEVGKTYNLTVNIEGKILTATTTIPAPVHYNSIYFKLQPNEDSTGMLWPTLSAPADPELYFRIFTKRGTKDRRYVPLRRGSVYNDATFQGQTVTFSLSRSRANLDNITNISFGFRFGGFFKLGDTISVRTCTVDKSSYDFWKAMEQEKSTNNNPFATPVSIPSNINGGLGTWTGYGADYETVYAK